MALNNMAECDKNGDTRKRCIQSKKKIKDLMTRQNC